MAAPVASWGVEEMMIFIIKQGFNPIDSKKILRHISKYVIPPPPPPPPPPPLPTHLMVVEDGYFVVGQFPFRHLVLAVQVPLLCPQLHVLGPTLEQLVVDRHGGRPAAQAALFGGTQAEETWGKKEGGNGGI